MTATNDKKARWAKIRENQHRREAKARSRVAGKGYKNSERLLPEEKQAIEVWIETGEDQDFLPEYYRRVNWRHPFFMY